MILILVAKNSCQDLLPRGYLRSGVVLMADQETSSKQTEKGHIHNASLVTLGRFYPWKKVFLCFLHIWSENHRQTLETTEILARSMASAICYGRSQHNSLNVTLETHSMFRRFQPNTCKKLGNSLVALSQIVPMRRLQTDTYKLSGQGIASYCSRSSQSRGNWGMVALDMHNHTKVSFLDSESEPTQQLKTRGFRLKDSILGSGPCEGSHKASAAQQGHDFASVLAICSVISNCLQRICAQKLSVKLLLCSFPIKTVFG